MLRFPPPPVSWGSLGFLKTQLTCGVSPLSLLRLEKHDGGLGRGLETHRILLPFGFLFPSCLSLSSRQSLRPVQGPEGTGPPLLRGAG